MAELDVTQIVMGKIDEMKGSIDSVKNQVTDKAAKAELDALAVKMNAMSEGEIKTLAEGFKAQETSITELKAQVSTIEKMGGKFGVEPQKKSFLGSLKAALTEKKDMLAAMVNNQGASVSLQLKNDDNSPMELKVVGDMTNATNLTGAGVQSYNTRQGLVPSQKVNFRDLIQSVYSPTMEYVTYRETGSEGAIAVQTEGSAKSQIDYDLTNVQVINKFLAGYVTFTRQMLKNLPWLSGTLPRLLVRDFYKAENASFWATALAAATDTVTVATDDVEATIAAIAALESRDYTASFGIVSPAQWARLAVSTYNKGGYQGAGSVQIEANGAISIAGVPIYKASWAADDTLLLVDADYIERVEAEALNVQYSYENADNFVKNKVTARVECMEVLNILRPDALQKLDYGNVA